MPRKNPRPQAGRRLAKLRDKIDQSNETGIPLRRRNGTIIRGAGAGAVRKRSWLAGAVSRVFGGGI